MTELTIQSVTRAIETSAQPALLLRILSDASNIPRWAPEFADSVRLVAPGRYRAYKAEQTFLLDLINSPPTSTIDYLREFPDGKRTGAYLRVLPLPRGGSVVIMTLPTRSAVSSEELADTLEEELTALARLAETQAI
jgi:hypothetical protein